MWYSLYPLVTIQFSARLWMILRMAKSLHQELCWGTQPLSLVMMDLSWLEIKSYSVRKMEPGMALPQSARLLLVSKGVNCIVSVLLIQLQSNLNQLPILLLRERIMKWS